MLFGKCFHGQKIIAKNVIAAAMINVPISPPYWLASFPCPEMKLLCMQQSSEAEVHKVTNRKVFAKQVVVIRFNRKSNQHLCK